MYLRTWIKKSFTWHCKDLEIPKYRTEFAKKGFYNAAIKLWNDTPVEIHEPTLSRFKKQLKTQLKAAKELDHQTQLPGRTAIVRRRI